MVYSLSLAGIHIKIVSEVALNVDQQLQAFLDPRGPEPDCRVDVSWDWNAVELPGPCDYMGEDLLCRYYRVGDQWYCLTKGRPGIPVSCAVYSADCRAISCTINAAPFLAPPDNLGSMLRMLPMRRISASWNRRARPTMPCWRVEPLPIIWRQQRLSGGKRYGKIFRLAISMKICRRSLLPCSKAWKMDRKRRLPPSPLPMTFGKSCMPMVPMAS